MKYLLCLCITFLLAQTSFAQQAWVHAQGSGYVQLGTTLFTYSSLHNGGDSPIELPRSISDNILSLYLEYGLTGKLTATAVLPYHLQSSGDLASGWSKFAPEKGTLNALGNTSIALTYQIVERDGIVFSTKLLGQLATSKYDDNTGLQSDYSTASITPSLLVGVGKSNYFFSGEIGYTLQGGDYLDRFILQAQLGTSFGIKKKLVAILAASNMSSLGQVDEARSEALDGNARLTGLYINDQSYLALTFKLGYKLNDRLSAWGSIAGGAATNVGRGIVFGLALGYDF